MANRKKGKGFNLKIKINLESILSNLITVGIASTAGILIAKFAQDHLGAFSYPNLDSTQIDKVANQYFKSTKLMSKACMDDYCRGVLSTGDGGSYYYFNHSPGKSFAIYPLVTELYSIGKNLIGDNPKLIFP